MSRQTIRQFADSSAGERFFDAYDSLLEHWPPDTETRDVLTEHGTTRVNVCGSPNGRPVILLPGAGATSAVFGSLAGRLGRTHRVFAIDLMGDVGRSVPHADRIASIAELHGWFDAVIGALGVHDVDVVAHSYGAMVAASRAVAPGSGIARLILLDPTSVFTGLSASYLLRAVPLLTMPTERRQRAFVEWECAGIGVDPMWMSVLTIGAAHFPRQRPVVPKKLSKVEFAAITADVSVVLAGRSKAHSASNVARKVHEVLPRARVVVLDSASHHSLPLEPADDVARTVIDCLAHPRRSG